MTLPDFQGMGFGKHLNDTLGSAYKALGFRFHTYPAHPALIRTRITDPKWKLIKQPGVYRPRSAGQQHFKDSTAIGGRPCATYQYIGPAMGRADAERLIHG